MKRSLLIACVLTGLCLLLSLVTMSMTGCASSGVPIVSPRYSIRDVRPRVDIALPVAQSSIDFDFSLGIENPNPVDLRLDRVEFALLINDNPILTSASEDQRLSIPAQGFGEAHLRTRVRYENIRNLFLEVVDMIQNRHAHYELRGTAWYDTPRGVRRFPVTVHSRE